MIVKVENDDKSTTAYMVHVYRSEQLSFERRQTICSIHTGECVSDSVKYCRAEYAMTGTSECSLKDTFNKAKGRKLAIARAIAECPREFRKRFWEAYFKVVKMD